MSDGEIPPLNDGSASTPRDGAASAVPAPIIPIMTDRIVDLDIDRELHESYLTYAMSTIMDRALPDVRDGLKPSQRRILVAMHDLKLSPGRKQIKCAKICGDTSGNYHPHGESVIYPTLVNLGQDWKTRYMLVDKQGNFGSIEGDPPAAMRYTEARMTAAAMALLEDLDKDTVDFRANYDERLMEPVVLPAKLPNLLVNGSSGIAVGLSSTMPPHNVGEICRAVIAVIDDPNITLDRLLEIVPGPDFPTGGSIMGRRGIVDAYATGRGKLVLRGKVRHEKVGSKSGKGGETSRDAIVIEEIPYQVAQNILIEKLVEVSKNDRIPDIADIRNHSGRNARTRIQVVLKKGADPAVVEKQLYEFTPLQTTYSIQNITLVNHQPRTLSLRQLLQCYIDHRKDVIRRRTEHLLRHARQAAHKLEGLIFAVCDIDEVIALIRSSRTREEAITRIQQRAFRISRDHHHAGLVPERFIARSESASGVLLTRVQAEAIGALRLIQLVGLEIEKLAAELSALLATIDELEAILASESRMLGIIRTDCEGMIEEFGDKRLTTIEVGEVEDFEMAELIPEHEVVVTISQQGYVKRLPLETYRTQARGGVGVKGQDQGDDDFVTKAIVCNSHDDLLCFTNTGRVFRRQVWQIPEVARTARGRAIQNLLELREGETVRTFLSVPDFEKGEDYLLFTTSQGKVKRTALKDYCNVHRSGIIAISLNEGHELIGVVQTRGDDHVLLSTKDGMSIRFHEDDARVMGRDAAGVRGIDLAENDEVVGVVRCETGRDLLTVTANGYGKRTSLDEYLVQTEDGSTRVQSRGGKGRIDIQTTDRNGRVVAIETVGDAESVVVSTSGGIFVRVPTSSISRIGRNTQGVRVVRLKEGDTVIAIASAGVETEVAAAVVSEGGDASNETGAEAPK